MPAKPGKSGADVKKAYNKFVGRMVGPKTEAAMAKVLSIGMTGAKELAPLEYGTLMNSAFRRIEKSSGGFRGVAGFANGTSKNKKTGELFNYAFYLHEHTNWSPRAPDKKKGPAWNPNAKPKYLERGFTDPLQRKKMQMVLGSTYKI